MHAPLSRRTTLRLAAAMAAASALPTLPVQATSKGLRLGPPQPFSFKRLTVRAEALAKADYRPPNRPAPEIVAQIDYETHGKIRFDPGLALFAEGPGAYPATFFHLGRYFTSSVKMHALERGFSRDRL